MLGNNNFNTYFKSNLIADCDVLIYNNLTSNLVLNRDNIKSFTMSRENDCALAFAPCDKVVIEIIGWNDLSAEAKECLSTPTVSSDDNYVWVQFQVERDVTDYCIPFIVQQCDIDIKNNNAKSIKREPTKKAIKDKTIITSSAYLSITVICFLLNLSAIYPAKGVKKRYGAEKRTVAIARVFALASGNIPIKNIWMRALKILSFKAPKN